MLSSTPIALTGSDQQVHTGPASYAGLVVRETGGAAAEVRVYAGTDATGLLIDVVKLDANEVANSAHGQAVRAQVGVFVDIVTGAVAGSVLIL